MKKIKKYLSKKEYIIFALSLVIILLSTFSFAFYYNVENTEENIVTSECFKLSFVDQDDINLDNAYPISDSEGSSLTPYIFTVKNVCKRAGDYQVNIETLNESDLSTNYLKYKLDNQSPSILGNQLEVHEYINENIKESKNIEAGVILPNEEITYNLRIWIDEASTYEQTSNKIYKSKVVVKTIDNKEPYQTITLNTNGGDLSSNEIIKVKTRTIGSIPEPTREDYTFLGWYLDSDFNNRLDSNMIVTEEIDNLYAKWYKYVYRYTHTGNYQTFIAPDEGEYKIELWGAGQKGAYTSGNINLGKNQSLYLYVGQAIISGSEGTNWNGGGKTTYLNNNYRGTSGGGASDVRTVAGAWNNTSSLRSRIMVAGGSGGNSTVGGAAGGLTGYTGQVNGGTAGTGGSQTAGGTSSGTGVSNGSFGIGASSIPTTSTDEAGSGGGGYFGGGAGYAGDLYAGGGGGSSYISGHTGCVAITSSSSSSPKSGCTTGTSTNSCSIHYSGLSFTNTLMIDGEGYKWTNSKGSRQQMPNPLGGYYNSGLGHSGSGYIKITYLGNPVCNVGQVYNYEYRGTSQQFVASCDGTYKIELWGAQGGNAKYSTQYTGGLGGYTSGNIDLDINDSLYVFVGGMGTSNSGTSTNSPTTNGQGYNGGGTGGFYANNSNGGYGGGATDVRLVNGNWDNFNSLKSRIMVAGGGGGADSHVNAPSWSGNGGAGGGLIGYESDKKGSCYHYGTGGTQTSPGTYTSCGSQYGDSSLTGGFGQGGTNTHSGGGGGYYGGSSGHHTSAAGGSSFISGYSNCNAINESSTSSNIVHTNQPNHYSGKVFTSGVMIDGKGCNWSTGSAKSCGSNQIQPSGSNATGHTGNGYARITLISTN